MTVVVAWLVALLGALAGAFGFVLGRRREPKALQPFTNGAKIAAKEKERADAFKKLLADKEAKARKDGAGGLASAVSTVLDKQRSQDP